MTSVFDLFAVALRWFGTHVLSIQIMGISLISWVIGIVIVGLVIVFFASFRPSMPHTGGHVSELFHRKDD